MAFNATEFLSALEEIETAKGISKEAVLEALKEAMIKGFKKQLGGDDATVIVNIDPIKGTIEMAQTKKVVEDVQDDFLEISVEDAREVDKKYKVGDDFIIPATLEDLRKATAMSIKSILRQKFAEAERGILYEQFKDKINTMITGKVENIDERGCSVNIGRTSVYLPRKEMIGNETFNVGDPIKLFVSDVASGTKGAHIVVSRANEGFLRCLMTEEIHEIYEGTITIRSIAREAGERSKVSVMCDDPNIDPAGACIGPNGSRIQKIVAQLGNGSNKEKIDIITYSPSAGLFILEALKPARTLGIIVDEENKTATAIVKDDSLSLAIGRKGVNARLAVKLTGFNIDIKTESEASELGLEYVSLEELVAQEAEVKARLAYEKARAAMEASTAKTEVLPGLPEGYVAPQERKYEDEIVSSDLDEALEAQVEEEDIPASKPIVKEEEPVVEVKNEVKEEKKETAVKTTTTLSDLEKKLEGSKAKTTTTSKKKKVEEAPKEEEKKETKADPSTFMSIYTDEELKEMENDEEEDIVEEEEDIDYDQYDEYYDDEK